MVRLCQPGNGARHRPEAYVGDFAPRGVTMVQLTSSTFPPSRVETKWALTLSLAAA